MRLFAALVIWLSGGWLFYKAMLPLVATFRAYFEQAEGYRSLKLEELVDLFAMPFFLLGILLYVSIPAARRARKREAAAERR